MNCYAEALMDHRYHRVKWGASGTRVRTKTWGDPVKWQRQCERDGTTRKVFCCSLADVFEDRPELEPWRDELFDLIDATPRLYWQILTKRPENIGPMWKGGAARYRHNVFRGTSPCDQRTAEASIPELIASNHLSPVAFLSAEPLLGPMNLSPWLGSIHWVIAGGESDQMMPARPCDVRWIAELIDQCRVADVPFFNKQLGNVHDGATTYKLRDKHGGDWSEWPRDALRVRQFPAICNRVVEGSCA